MRELALKLELDEPEKPGIWPWIIAGTASLALVIVSARLLDSIPNALELSARQAASGADMSNLKITADGRDITVTGIIPDTLDRNAFVHQLATIDGVRVVRDGLSVFDPVADTAARVDSFISELNNINVAAVAFEPGSAQFAEGSDGALQSLVQLLSSSPDHRIRVAGHTDNTGRSVVNLRLSRERAAAVKSYLVARGVDQGRVIAQGYGATQPIADNSTEPGRTSNRRIEISYVN
ncbi:MAG: OmpA family protein [Granulosicoccus sp.]